VFLALHPWHRGHEHRLELATVQMPPAAPFPFMDRRPLTPERTTPDGLRANHFHLHFPLGWFEGDVLDRSWFHQAQNLLIKLKIFHAANLTHTPSQRNWIGRPLGPPTGRTQRSEASAGALRLDQ
jgi:hypothetical protein